MVHLSARQEKREVLLTVEAEVFSATTKCDLLANELVDLVAQLGGQA